MKNLLYLVLVNVLVVLSKSAKILVVVPTPSISHQVPFRPLTQELARRGHDVTVITTDPAFPKGQTPENLTEIDLHDISYDAWRELMFKSGMTNGDSNDIVNQIAAMLPVMSLLFEKQLNSDEVQSIIKSKTKYDLLMIEACSRPAIVFSHIFKDTPVVQISSFGGILSTYNAIGAPSYPALLYPTMLRQRLHNLTIWEKITELYNHFLFVNIFENNSQKDDQMLKKIFGKDTPTQSEMENNVDLVLLNLHPMWDENRPVPPGLVYIGGIHQKPTKELPADLQAYLDSSKKGVIYISFGTNVSPSQLPPERIQLLVNVFSKLPYDVLWKWDKDELPGRSDNIRISKWLPQSDLLKHPKVKLFITQGGLQSTDEAIIAGVPLIGMPMLGDQWYNVEQYVSKKVGLRLDLGDLTEEKFLTGLNTVLKDSSYRKNMERLRSLMHDQPQSALSRAVWWTEHVIRHGGGRHLRAPAANMSWAEYLDVQLLAVLALIGTAGFGLLGIVLYFTLNSSSSLIVKNNKLKQQ